MIMFYLSIMALGPVGLLFLGMKYKYDQMERLQKEALRNLQLQALSRGRR